MSERKLITKMLKLVDVKVAHFEVKTRSRMILLWVKPYKNGCQCPECHRRGTIVCTLKTPRYWRDICVAGQIVYFAYCPREIWCPTHGRLQEEIPWADTFSRVTYRLEYLMLIYAQLMTQKAAASLLKMPTSTFSDILHRTVERTRDGHRIRGLKSIGIDEVSYHKGHKYVTVVYDLERARVVWVGPGKARDTIDGFFKNKLSDYQKRKIKYASCDMSETFIGAIKEHCPNAKLVLDHFHITKALIEAVDEVRKEQWREAVGDERKALKGLRWLLYRHPSNRDRGDKEVLDALRRGNRRIYRACVLRDEFEQFWNYRATWAAKRFLKRWTTAALRSRLDPLRKFVATIRKHTDNIITFIESGGLTNAVAEGLNRIIRMLKNRASGFRNVDAFIDLIYVMVGDLDIPAQIPCRFRTL